MGKTFSTGLLTNGIWQDASNNIGIGGSPSGTYKFEVTGTAKVSSTLLVSGAATFSSSVSTGGALNITVPYSAGTMTILTQDNLGNGIYLAPRSNLNFDYGVANNTTGIINNFGYQNGSAHFRSLGIGDGKGGTIAFFDGVNSRVGIGTSNPTNILSFGNSAAQKIWIENTAADVAGKALTISAGSTIAGSALPNVAGGTLTLQAGLGTGTTGTSQIVFQTGQSLGGGATLMGYTTRMAVLNGFVVTVPNAVATTLFNIASTINVGSMALVTVYATSGSGLGMATLIIMRDGYGSVSQAQLGTQPTANYLSFTLSGTNLQITVALGAGNHDIKGSIVMIAS